MTETLSNAMTVLAPTVWVVLVALAVMSIDLIVPKRNSLLQWFAILGLVAGFIYTLTRQGCSGSAFHGMAVQNNFTWYFDLLFIGIALFTILLSGPYFNRTGIKYPETLTLILLATSGAMLMVVASDFIVLFLGLELMSVCLYVLAGMLRDRPKANEGALKYFLLGAFSTGFFIYGIALIIGLSGTSNYREVGEWAVRQNGNLGLLFWSGVGLMMIGFFFKAAAVPFHFWSPDAYEGAPTPVTAFFSTGPKAAAFGALIKVLGIALSATMFDLASVVAVIAILTMAIGNFIALQQSSVKRMLAYSSIAHAGYLLVAVVAANETGASALLFYSLVYAATNLGAFTIAYLVNREQGGNYSFEDYNGLGSKHPFLAGLMAVFMISLAGIPPTGGFIGKYYIFYAAMMSGNLWLAIMMALLSAVSVYYYLRIIVHMFMKPAADEYKPVVAPFEVQTGLVLCVVLILCIGLLPANLFATVTAGIKAMGM